MTIERPLPNAPAAAASPSFVDGVTCFFSGLGFLVRTPGAWPLALVPVALVVVLGGALSSLAIAYLPDTIAGLIGATGEGESHGGLTAVFSTAAQILVTVVAIAASFLAAFGLAQPLSGPAFEALVRRQEAALGVASRPDSSFFADVVSALSSSLVGFLFATPILVVLFAVSFFFPPAQVVTVPLKVFVAVLVLAWDLCDVPLSLRQVPMRRRIAILRAHFGAVVGMAAGVALLAFVPCGILLAMPIGVLGATHLVHRIEQVEGPLRP